jgi:hypothetical protein
MEQERSELVDRRVENEAKEANSRAEALRAMLEPIRNVDWRTLMAAQSGGIDSRQLIALAFHDLADNAGKIGQLNISPDLLTTLLGDGVGDGVRMSAGDRTQQEEPRKRG